jgi:hypothetical protein
MAAEVKKNHHYLTGEITLVTVIDARKDIRTKIWTKASQHRAE